MSRFRYRDLLAGVEAALPGVPGEKSETRRRRADATTTNGLRWLTDLQHRHLVKELDGSYGRWSSVSGVLLETERMLSDIRLALEKIALERGRQPPFGPFNGPSTVRQR